MREDDIYLWIHERLRTTGKVSLDGIPDQYDDPDVRNFVREYLDALVRRDIVAGHSDGQFKLEDPEAEREAYYQVLESETLPGGRGVTDETYQPVVSIPTKHQEEWKDYAEHQNINSGVWLENALAEVFETADSTLRLVVPFFELDGLLRLEDEFHQAASSGANIKFLTRELLRPADDFGHNRGRKAILELMDRFESVASSESSLSVYDFYHAIGGKQPKLDRSIHAKMIIADNQLAYVGSGELRNSSMMLNGEAGYLTRSQTDIETWTGFFDFFEAKADAVTREILEESVE
ncbi:phospholipase D-like domain-containing protein [Natrinema marinum]|uniref:phospholipase D-like domain-containing protein n=1 Tax=Natrinema marinum TaxID=2961598 RepID=UPI0020C8C100|nr:phospholipase D-like domain-containing protein [Natrinema marinum]